MSQQIREPGVLRGDDAEESRLRLIERYLRGQLSDDERFAFELRLLDDAALFDEVQEMDALHEALRSERAQLTADPQQRTAYRSLPPALWLRQPLSLAACLALALTLAFHALPQRPQAGIEAPLAVGSFTLLETLRGAGEPLRVDGAGPHLLQIDVGQESAASFDLDLRDASGAVLFTLNGLEPDVTGWLRVLLPDEFRGDYRLELRPEAGAARHFDLRFISSPAANAGRP